MSDLGIVPVGDFMRVYVERLQLWRPLSTRELMICGVGWKLQWKASSTILSCHLAALKMFTASSPFAEKGFSRRTFFSAETAFSAHSVCS